MPEDRILHAYIPTVEGKERRKAEGSKEGILGVEGIDRDALIEAIRSSGAHILTDVKCETVGEELAPPVKTDAGLHEGDSVITKLDFFDFGLTGAENAARMREEVLSSLGLPKYLSANAMIDALNCLFTKEEFEEYLNQLNIHKK